MLDIEDVIHWLRECGNWQAADVLSQCEFTYDFVDLAVRLDGGADFEVYDLKIEAPGRILKRISGDLKPVIEMIEEAISECTQSLNVHIRGKYWVPKLRSDASSPSDPEIEATLATVDSDHVKRAWAKAMNRRQSDPDGAITSAETLVESVCKHILSRRGVTYPTNPDITKLCHMVCDELRLSPDQHVDKNIKRILGNCQAVVGGIAFIRNHLGDAHSREPGTAAPIPADAELAVNLAGALATFLVRTWEKQEEDSEQHAGQGSSEAAPSASPDEPSV
jgi:hypothetical protein